MPLIPSPESGSESGSNIENGWNSQSVFTQSYNTNAPHLTISPPFIGVPPLQKLCLGAGSATSASFRNAPWKPSSLHQAQDRASFAAPHLVYPNQPHKPKLVASATALRSTAFSQPHTTSLRSPVFPPVKNATPLHSAANAPSPTPQKPAGGQQPRKHRSHYYTHLKRLCQRQLLRKMFYLAH